MGFINTNNVREKGKMTLWAIFTLVILNTPLNTLLPQLWPGSPGPRRVDLAERWAPWAGHSGDLSSLTQNSSGLIWSGSSNWTWFVQGHKAGVSVLAVSWLPWFLCVAHAGAGTLMWVPAFTCWVPGLAWLEQPGSGRTSLSRRAWMTSCGGSLRRSDFLPSGQHPQSKSSQIS